MKKIFFLSIIAILGTACNKDLDQLPISSATTAVFYQKQIDFVQAINAVYSDLHNYPDRLDYLSEIRSDNIYGVSVTVRDWDPINDFAQGIAGNTYVEEAWSTDFNGIFRANVLLDQLAKNGANVGSAALALRLQAEARYLRAFFYFDLVKYFGKVPIVDHPLTVAEATTLGRSKVADVYAFMMADLQFAITNLPPVYTGADLGRATKYAAEATLGLVYMTRSGPTYGIEGPGLGLNEWALAVPLFNDIINSGNFVFNPNYASIFSYANQSPTKAVTAGVAGNGEAIFDIMYVGGISGTTSQYGADFVWQLTPAGYFTSLKAPNSNGSLEIIPVSNDLTNAYQPGDTRKAQTIYTAGYTVAGSTENRPFYKKYIDITNIPVNSRFDWAINFIAIRYTDILLLKAECVLHGAPGNQITDVDNVVNQVRNRAFAPVVPVPLVGVTLPQLFAERRLEFANEGSRWFDLQRSGNLVTIMNAWINTEDTQHRMSAVTNNYVIYPVPQTQLDAVPGLYLPQNTGY